ncbi:MAG TPA: OmpA family protein [Chitinophagaceae bacterium]|nr:OmpA family protein [Chitinophagaceae bacterium]
MNNLLSFNKNNILSMAKQTLLLLVISISLPATGQQENPLTLAEKYFSEGDYYTAAYLYEQYLSPGKKRIPGANFPLNASRYKKGSATIHLTKFDVIYKQAHSYRLANYWPEAAAKYKQCFDKDSVKYADALYWIAVCQRSLGNYAKAEESISRYKNGYGNTTIPDEMVQKEKQTLHFIQSEIVRPDSILYHVQKLNTYVDSIKGIYAATRINRNQLLVTSTETDTSAKLGANPYHNRMYYAVTDNNVIQNLESVNIPGTDIWLNQGAACFNVDGSILYFTQWKKINGKTVSSIYYSLKKEGGWTNPVLLQSVNKSGFSSKQPFCSADGKNLFFASDMPGGIGGFDIWYAPILADGSTGEPVNIVGINTKADEQAPFYHASGNTLVFSSNGRIGMGGFDLFTAKLKDGEWVYSGNMGHPVNSSRDDIYFFATEGKGLLTDAMISSDRGAGCCLETYIVSKLPKKKIITGSVKDLKSKEPIADVVVIMKDADGNVVETTTSADGKFSFEAGDGIEKNKFILSKSEYKSNTSPVSIENINESDWLTDVINNTPIYMEKKLVIKVENVVTVYFDFDKSDIKPHSAEVLDSIYTVLIENSSATVQISGYTDGLGTVEYNNVLSDKRARACADYLIQKGIDASRISFESFGECCPVELELINGKDNPEGRSKNRRALINISKE